MGPEIAIAMMAGGKLLEMQASQEQADNRRKMLNSQLERDDKATQNAIQLVQDESGNYTTPNRQEALAEQQNKTYQQIDSDMQGAGGASVNTASGAGNVSEDFLKTKASRAVDEGTRLTSIAREAAKSRAPGQLMTNDALRRAGMAGNLQNIFGTNRNMANATGLDAESIQAPMYGSLGSIASAIGTGYAMNAYGKTPKLPGGMVLSGSPAPTGGIAWG